MNNPPNKAKGYDPGLERSRAQDRKKAKGYDPGLERSRAQDQYRKNAKRYDLELERTLSQKPNLINNFRLFFRRNKFARLVANIVISLIWIGAVSALWLYGLFYFYVKLCSYNIFFNTFNCSNVKIYLGPYLTLSALLTFLPPLWLTWYLWIRKRVPKNK